MPARAVTFCGVAFRGSKPLPPSGAIDRLEKAIGLPLPEDYREFLQTVNGGKPKPAGYKYPRWERSEWPEARQVDGSGMMPRPNAQQVALLQANEELHANTRTPPRIDVFYHVGRGSESLQDSLIGQHPFSNNADASSLLTIAFSDLSIPIYVSLSKSHYGAIFQFDEDFDFDPGPDITLLQDLDDLRIADSFSELLQGLFNPKPIFKPGFTPNEVHLVLLRQRT